MKFELIDPLDHTEKVVELLKHLNPEKDLETIKMMLKDMVKMPNYNCFAIFSQDELIAISSGWTTVKIYSGKQLELDNVIVDPNLQSKGLGTYFINQIKQWSLDHGYKHLGLNTYITNSRSHKFYHNQDFNIVGFHFEHVLDSFRS